MWICLLQYYSHWRGWSELVFLGLVTESIKIYWNDTTGSFQLSATIWMLASTSWSNKSWKLCDLRLAKNISILVTFEIITSFQSSSGIMWINWPEYPLQCKLKKIKYTELGIVTKRKIGSSRMIETLNRFGHCILYDEINHVETSFAELHIRSQELRS